VWALVETALWFPSSGGRRSSVHGCGSVHAVVELRESLRDLHHLTGHYLVSRRFVLPAQPRSRYDTRVRLSVRFATAVCAALCLVFACSRQPCGRRVPGRVVEPSVLEYTGEGGSARLKLLGADSECTLAMTPPGPGQRYERCVLTATARFRMTTAGGNGRTQRREPRVVFSIVTDSGLIMAT